MKLRNLEVRIIEAGTAGELEQEVNAWLVVAGVNDELVDIRFYTDGTSFWCFITYVGE